MNVICWFVTLVVKHVSYLLFFTLVSKYCYVWKHVTWLVCPPGGAVSFEIQTCVVKKLYIKFDTHDQFGLLVCVSKDIILTTGVLIWRWTDRHDFNMMAFWCRLLCSKSWTTFVEFTKKFEAALHPGYLCCQWKNTKMMVYHLTIDIYMQEFICQKLTGWRSNNCKFIIRVSCFFLELISNYDYYSSNKGFTLICWFKRFYLKCIGWLCMLL